MDNPEGLSTISVCGNEIPLNAYWKVIDLWNAGKTNEAIVAHILRKMKNCNPKLIGDIVFHIIDNQKRMDKSPGHLKRKSAVLQKSKRTSTYRASRIEAQAELAEAEARLALAQDEEDKAAKRTFDMINKKGDTSVNVKWMNDPETQEQEALEWFQAAKLDTDTAKKLVNIHRSSLR